MWRARLSGAEADFYLLPCDRAARAFGQVAASLRRSEHQTTARTYDAMIAATALANSLPLYTANPADLAGIEGLTIHALRVPDGS